MASYLVTYEQRNRAHNYEALIQTLESFPEWSRPLESVWIVVCNLTPSALREKLTNALDPNDPILIVKTGKLNAWQGLSSCLTSWMGKHL